MHDELTGLRAISVRHSYTIAHNDLARDFFVPALTCSTRYDRGVGYFTSGWLKANAQGIASLGVAGGCARWITSPLLARQDLVALLRAASLENEPKIVETLLASVETLQDAIESDTLNALSWLVADGILNFRFAIPIDDLDGDFHDKFGIFEDVYGQRLSFSGSYNDTAKGLRNYESIRVFRSWDPSSANIVAEDEERFMRLWDGQESNLRIFDPPYAVKHRILQLRRDARPYDIPQSLEKVSATIQLRGVFP